MFIISLKKVIIILLIILFITAALICGYLLSKSNIKEKIVDNTSLTYPEKKTVIIDAGHGGEDGGAISKNGLKESDVNLKIAFKLKSILEGNNFNVVLTRSDENAIYDEDAKTLRQKKISDLKNRVKIANTSNADIFISIHLNKAEQEKYYGWQCFYNEKNEKSKDLALLIQNALNETIDRKNKRKALKITNVYIIDNIEIPAVIVECGFLSNKTEEELLNSDEYQEKLALGIYKGIFSYFEKH